MDTEHGPLTMIVAVLFGVALLCGYVALAIYLTRQLWRVMAGQRDWAKVLACTLVLTLFFAPAAVGAGHGAAIAPAWVALVDPDSNRFAIRGALISLTITWAILFVVGVIVRSRKHPTKQQ